MEKYFEQAFSQQELKLISRLDSPLKIQAFLDGIPYSEEEIYRCPRSVIRDRKAHCFDGALFAAAALRYIGYPPLVLDMLPNHRDDDHMLALYKVDGLWGAVAKSNFPGLRFREPIHRNLRELVLSYFEPFFNLEREKTLRGYTRPFDLRVLDSLNWMGSDENMEAVVDKLNKIRRYSLLTPRMEAGLSLLDERSYQAGMLGVNMAGVYVPGKAKPGTNG
jgi:hypothetical protein